MFDVALAEAGAQVVLASSCDEKHPPECVIDGKPDTLWCTTGNYPQELIITFTSLMNINTVSVACYNLKNLSIERSTQHTPIAFEFLEEKEAENVDRYQQQNLEFNFTNTTALHLKFSIESGSGHFVSINNINVDGTAVPNA
ncbi:intraflagellar transport protein 25 homolog [Tubulanus polymorphus]|uniref:intraflagellar transport protein 25 homolog n=1 Tax=Tubulanus polymorphus TaxID=672921 RepID=UPI003DA577E9